MYFYALYYYRKATTLRPYDARMWCALAGCYAHLDRTEEAVRCYSRAEVHGDREGIAAMRLAQLHADKLGDDETAAQYYLKHLQRRGVVVENLPGSSNEKHVSPTPGHAQDSVEALRFLARYYKDKGDIVRAEMYCHRLLECSGPEREEAKGLIRAIKSVTQES